MTLLFQVQSLLESYMCFLLAILEAVQSMSPSNHQFFSGLSELHSWLLLHDTKLLPDLFHSSGLFLKNYANSLGDVNDVVIFIF